MEREWLHIMIRKLADVVGIMERAHKRQRKADLHIKLHVIASSSTAGWQWTMLCR
jgi:hypothetical protein